MSSNALVCVFGLSCWGSWGGWGVEQQSRGEKKSETCVKSVYLD